jgi:hypothetical protein
MWTDWEGFGRQQSWSIRSTIPEFAWKAQRKIIQKISHNSQYSSQDSNQIQVKSVTATPDRAVAQAVSRWLPTAAVRVRVRAEHVVLVVDKVALG